MDTINQLRGKQQNFDNTVNIILRFFRKFNIGTILNRSGIKKSKGIPPSTILQSLFSLAFIGKNIYRGIVQNESEVFCKDAAYDFLKCPNYNWRKTLLSVGASLFSFFHPLTSDERENVLIIDDSPYNRSRSKKVELLAKVYDHAESIYIKGFRLLTVCWSDGVSTIPLDFALLSSAKQKNRYQEITKKLDKRTCGYKRRKEALTKATGLLGPMVKRVLSYHIKVDYILMDSWFGWPKLISQLHQSAPVICMVKKTEKILYGYEKAKLDVKAIYQKLKKRRGRAKILANAIVTLSDGTPVKLVFVRDRRKKDWLVLLSSKTDLPDEDIVRLYGRRWDFEVFFKMAKQHLKLVKGIQARDFDSLVAHTTIVFMRYQFLSYEQRMHTDYKTFGDLYYACCEEVKDITFIESLQRILSLAIDKKRKASEFSEEAYRVLIDAIMGQAIKFFDLEELKFQRTQGIA